MVFEATYLVTVLTAGHMSLCCGQNGAQMSKGLRPINKVKRHVHLLSCGRSKNGVGMWTCPPAMREAAAGIFLWAAWGLHNTIKGNKFKHIHFSHD